MVKIEREIPIQIDPGENPFLKGVYAPIATEITADDLTVIGEIPRDLDGAYLRNGPNPIFQPRGRYHWFDGDGMVHGIEFHDGKATYRNRWIRTEGFVAEQNARRTIWPGLMDRPDPNVPRGAGSDGWLKDSANTDLVFHNGYALAQRMKLLAVVDPAEAKRAAAAYLERFPGGFARPEAQALVDRASP